jgi:hypothetical protein
MEGEIGENPSRMAEVLLFPILSITDPLGM